MIKNVYVIFDTLANETVTPLFLCNNDDVAKRTFFDYVTGNPSVSAKDCQLRYLSTFDTEMDSIFINDHFPANYTVASYADFNMEVKNG